MWELEETARMLTIRHLQIRQMDQSTKSPEWELSNRDKYMASTANAPFFVVSKNNSSFLYISIGDMNTLASFYL